MKPFLLPLTLIIFVISCAGGAGSMTFENLSYPVTLTKSIDIEGKRYGAGDLAPGKPVVIEKRFWSFVYTGWDLTGEVDLSQTINDTISSNGGVAMRSVKITAEPCANSYFMPLTWVWFFPSCTLVTIEGEVLSSP
ncbi:MAG TPA: hypothetical protein DEA96_04900 [Leptospiraceae bacterium]|nr:hypothetical protein [Spirochaetaceae bacterium]HBS04282.1 hypothetical protein [Leptospiraceae bacterium]|tara:strand:- start:77710 stop:78117 length:408 start_codon:yes stop_codon:yes gene_type:complete